MSQTVARLPTPLYVHDVSTDGRTGGFVLPTGTVTFLMTDIEGSTRAWVSQPEALAAAIPRHYEILDDAISSHGGVRPVEQGEGDSIVAAFSRASDAIAAAVEAQRLLEAEPWDGDVRLAVRMAIHTGEAQLRDEGNYFGLAVIRCARLRSCGHGGQVLVSDVTAGLVADGLRDGATLLDLGRHRLKDLGRPERVWQLVHPELPTEFPPLVSLDAFVHNLPLQLSPLIGRGCEITELATLLNSERLVTLTGSGGVGKTRLALAVGAEVVGAFSSGVWFVELAAASGSGSAGRATLKALGAIETPRVAPAEIAAVELGSAARSLVILDNCEHILDDCAEFATTVLRTNPAVSILATSREPLGLDGEVAWRVPSLPAPPKDREPLPVGALSQYDAVTLFVDRARRARPSFTANDGNADAIAQVCQRLDGIPLAVELAAARCRHLGVERIAAELDDRFRLLTGGSRMVMPRQQTLAASVEWSFDLLDEIERRVLRRLGVFTGPFSLEAAEAVVSAVGDVDAVEVFDTISRLVDKSLVITEDAADADRYRLLETIRAFAINRARDAGELLALGDIHAAWWSERLEALRVTGPTDDVIVLVDTNHEDLVAALSWASERDTELGLRLLWPLARAYQGTGRAGDALAAIDTLLAPEVEEQYPAAWLRGAVSASVPMMSFRGPQAFVELLARCETTALSVGDEYRLAITRWLMDMSIASGLELKQQAERHREPYAFALATVRYAIDAVLDQPQAARQALHDADAVAASYRSRYIVDFATTAHGAQELVFGDVAVVVDAGHRLVGAPTRPMQENGYWLLVEGGLLQRDEDAIRTALDAAKHAAVRKVPGSGPRTEIARSFLALLAGGAIERQALSDDAQEELHLGLGDWLVGRDHVDRGDDEAARGVASSLREGGATRRAMAHALHGLIEASEDEWHRALRLADEHGLRLIAVDTLEALGAGAADADSSVEALRLLGAADRLRQETGYLWRFPGEQRRFDAAVRAARDDRGDAGDGAWEEGHNLDWHEAVTYAERARGERARPRHGWASLTPTEQQVVELVVAGHTNPEIAGRLLMGRGTVKSHLEHVYAKTGCRNRAELAAVAVEHRHHDR
jgi:predicted ATPase/class 3 adenylate cyclase/DNA-binding CsgD family transcriptional regulator